MPCRCQRSGRKARLLQAVWRAAVTNITTCCTSECGEMEDGHYGCAADKSATTVLCYISSTLLMLRRIEAVLQAKGASDLVLAGHT